MDRDVPAQDEKVKQLESELAALRRADSLGDIAATLFGELRCLMAPVSMCNEVLAKRLAGDGELSGLAGEAATASAFATRLLRATLDYVEQPGPTAAGVEVELRAVIGPMQGLLVSVLGPALALETSLMQGEATLRVDRLGLERLLLNLVCHFRHHAAEGGRVTLHTGVEALDGARAREVGSASPGPHAAVRVAAALAPGGGGRSEAALTRARELAATHAWGFSTKEEAGRVTGVSVYLPVMT